MTRIDQLEDRYEINDHLIDMRDNHKLFRIGRFRSDRYVEAGQMMKRSTWIEA